MARRKTTNRTGINRIEGIAFHDAWVVFVCVNCQSPNFVRIGQQLLKPSEAFEECVWVCAKCGFAHSKEADIPLHNWEDALRSAESEPAEYFWKGFFRAATEHTDSYWKQCNACGRILPFAAFSRHAGWGPLERQMECRACKGAIDHILPSKWLYPLTKENAALLSRAANEAKRDRWPSEFYTNSELIELARLTGADLTLLTRSEPVVNHRLDINRGVERYLQVREQSNLEKRVKEIKKIIRFYALEDRLNATNRRLLGFDVTPNNEASSTGQDIDAK
jgi:hypothetical protein